MPAHDIVDRQAERDHTVSLTHGQRYVLRELRPQFGVTTDEDVREQINVLEKAFRGPITPAVNQLLNRLRRNSVIGSELLRSLSEIYLQHNMRDWLDRRAVQIEEQPIPRIICSEAFS